MQKRSSRSLGGIPDLKKTLGLDAKGLQARRNFEGSQNDLVLANGELKPTLSGGGDESRQHLVFAEE